jgi:hypothetical protein
MDNPTAVEKITVRTKANCKYCLGSGEAMTLYAGIRNVCPCVTEQLRIIVTKKDYKIPAEQRYTPGQAEFVKE